MNETEKFYQWMQSINNAFLSDSTKMANAFEIVALQDENHKLKEQLLKIKKVLNIEVITEEL